MNFDAEFIEQKKNPEAHSWFIRQARRRVIWWQSWQTDRDQLYVDASSSEQGRLDDKHLCLKSAKAGSKDLSF
jgi:hypothetical protein